MQCCRCGALHTQAHPLIVAEARLFCAACLAWQDTPLRDGDGWVPPYEWGMPPYHPSCRANTTYGAQPFTEGRERSWLSQAFDDATDTLFARLHTEVDTLSRKEFNG